MVPVGGSDRRLTGRFEPIAGELADRRAVVTLQLFFTSALLVVPDRRLVEEPIHDFRALLVLDAESIPDFGLSLVLD